MSNFFKELDRDSARAQDPGYQLWKAESRTIRLGSDPYLRLNREERKEEAIRAAQSFRSAAFFLGGRMTQYPYLGENFWESWEQLAKVGVPMISAIEFEDGVSKLLASDTPASFREGFNYDYPDLDEDLEECDDEGVTVTVPVDPRGVFSLHATGSTTLPSSLG